MDIPSLAEFAENPDSFYAAIGRRFLEIASKQPTGLQDPAFVDRCLHAMELGDEVRINAILDELGSDGERSQLIRLCSMLSQNEPG